MKLKLYTKDKKDLVYFQNTSGDPNAPESIEDGGSKAPEVRKALLDWIHDCDELELGFLGEGDHLTYNALYNIYKEKYIIEVEDLPEPEPEPEPDRDYRKFLIE